MAFSDCKRVSHIQQRLSIRRRRRYHGL